MNNYHYGQSTLVYEQIEPEGDGTTMQQPLGGKLFLPHRVALKMQDTKSAVPAALTTSKTMTSSSGSSQDDDKQRILDSSYYGDSSNIPLESRQDTAAVVAVDETAFPSVRKPRGRFNLFSRSNKNKNNNNNIHKEKVWLRQASQLQHHPHYQNQPIQPNSSSEDWLDSMIPHNSSKLMTAGHSEQGIFLSRLHCKDGFDIASHESKEHEYGKKQSVAIASRKSQGREYGKKQSVQVLGIQRRPDGAVTRRVPSSTTSSSSNDSLDDTWEQGTFSTNDKRIQQQQQLSHLRQQGESIAFHTLATGWWTKGGGDHPSTIHKRRQELEHVGRRDCGERLGIVPRPSTPDHRSNTSIASSNTLTETEDSPNTTTTTTLETNHIGNAATHPKATKDRRRQTLNQASTSQQPQEGGMLEHDAQSNDNTVRTTTYTALIPQNWFCHADGLVLTNLLRDLSWSNASDSVNTAASGSSSSEVPPSSGSNNDGTSSEVPMIVFTTPDYFVADKTQEHHVKGSSAPSASSGKGRRRGRRKQQEGDSQVDFVPNDSLRITCLQTEGTNNKNSRSSCNSSIGGRADGKNMTKKERKSVRTTSEARTSRNSISQSWFAGLDYATKACLVGAPIQEIVIRLKEQPPQPVSLKNHEQHGLGHTTTHSSSKGISQPNHFVGEEDEEGNDACSAITDPDYGIPDEYSFAASDYSASTVGVILDA